MSGMITTTRWSARSGRTRCYGFSGDDIIVGGYGEDHIDGNNGNDLLAGASLEGFYDPEPDVFVFDPMTATTPIPTSPRRATTGCIHRRAIRSCCWAARHRDVREYPRQCDDDGDQSDHSGLPRQYDHGLNGIDPVSIPGPFLLTLGRRPYRDCIEFEALYCEVKAGMSPFFSFNSGYKLALQTFGHPFGVVVDQVDHGPGECLSGSVRPLLPVLQGLARDGKALRSCPGSGGAGSCRLELGVVPAGRGELAPVGVVVVGQDVSHILDLDRLRFADRDYEPTSWVVQTHICN